MSRLADDRNWFTTREVAGLRLHVLTTRKFKVETARLALRLPLRREDVTANALVPFVLRRGTRQLPTLKAIARHLEGLYGARLGIDVSKIGGTQLVEIRGEAVADAYLPGHGPGTGQLEALLRLIFEVLLEPAMADGHLVPQYVQQEKEILRRRIEGVINNKRQYALHRLIEEMFAGEPFSLHRLGRLEDLPALDAAALFRHYRERILGFPADLLVVNGAGADSVAELTQRVLDALGYRPGAQERHEPAPAAARDGRGQDGTPKSAPPRVVTEAQDVRQGVLALGYRTPVRFDSPDYPAMVMYNGVLGGFPHSKLFTHVRERNSLAYFVYSRLESSQGALIVSAGIDPALRDKALAIIERQIAAMRQGEMEAGELEATRRALIRRWRVSEDEPNTLIDHYLSGLVNGRQRPFSELIADVRRIGADQIVAAAQTVTPDTFYFLTSNAAEARVAQGATVRQEGDASAL